MCGPDSLTSTILAIKNAVPEPALLAAGVSCQPYSQLGDAKGGLDDRARSLPFVLRAATLLQSSAVVLECVCQAASDAWVRSV